MNATQRSLLILSTLMLSSESFTVSTINSRSTFAAKVTTLNAAPTPFFLDEVESAAEPSTTTATEAVSEAPQAKATEPTETPVVTKAQNPKKPAVKKPNHKEGVFSPIVFASKAVMGEDNLNKLRGKVISLHSNVIGSFVDTHTTPIGSAVAQNLFVVMDVNNDGTLDKEELKAAFQKLGFTWLQDKQVEGIMNRADKDKNGVIDYDEFEAELSKTLRTNLIKLAKKNGEAMGLLV